MEILRQNPACTAFVGLITVPSNQKTGHKNSINTTMFSAKVNKTNQTLTIWLMSTVMKLKALLIQESCTKLHLTLLSQLVNAVSLVVLVT
jgi:hypothetical protein